MMNDWWNQNVLTKYDFEVKSIRRGRGCYICETNQGVKTIQEYKGQEEKLVCEAALYEKMYGEGIPCDRPILNCDGTYCTVTDRGTYILRDWFDYEECQVHNEEQLRTAVQILGKLHHLFYETGELGEGYLRSARRLDEEMERYYREMRHIYKYMKSRKQRNLFEQTALDCFPAMEEQAKTAIHFLREKSDYPAMFQTALKKRSLCHGNYHYHNVLLGTQKSDSHIAGCSNENQGDIAKAKPEVPFAVIDFVGVCIQVQVYDLYHFLRKTMEKTKWDIHLGDAILEEYARNCELNEKELQVMQGLFLFPLKYRKQLNHYFAGSKVWIPAKDLEKMSKCVAQEEQRGEFIKSIFGR